MSVRGSRSFALGMAAFLVAMLSLAPAASAGEKGFKYGVTAGDVSQSSAILWAKATGAGTALAQVSTGKSFGGCSTEQIKSASGKFKVNASSDNDLTVQKKIGGLKPGRTYHYRWCMSGGRHSSTGTFDTAPAPNQAKTIHFSVSGDQDAARKPGESKPYWNNFQIWNKIRAEKNNFNVLLGDTIYSDSEVPGAGGFGKVALTVPQKWAKYKLNLGEKPWVNARGSTSYYAHWDDHEFINDFAQSENVFPETGGDVHINGKTLYKRSVKAFRNYNPVTYSKKTGIYRTVQWGKNLQIFLLDERSFRSSRADYGGACQNAGSPDLAPTAPQATRNVFGILIPQLLNPAPAACLTKINDPSRTMLGKNQLATFESAIKKSKATFKVILNEVPIQQYYALPYDRWEGYAAERTKLLTFLQAKVKNALFLTTDVHANLVNDARLKTLEPGGPVNSGVTEITTGPTATKNYSHEINDATGGAYAALIHNLFFKPAPPSGVGMQCAGTDQFSYAEVTVTKTKLKVDLKALDQGGKVLDTADTSVAGAPACGPYVLTKK